MDKELQEMLYEMTETVEKISKELTSKELLQVKELNKLQKYLEEHNYVILREDKYHPVPIPIMSHQIIVFHNEEDRNLWMIFEIDRRAWDVVCHDRSLGGKQGLLEIMNGSDKIIEEQQLTDNIKGYLTAEDVIKLLENYKKGE